MLLTTRTDGYESFHSAGWLEMSFLRKAVLAVLVGSVMGSTGASAAQEPPRLGRKIVSFELQDYLGAEHSLAEWGDKQVLVVVFLGTECPLAKLYGQRLAELANRYADQSVQFVGINSNRQDTLQEIAHYARKHGIAFPLLKDPANKVADQFGAVRTPEAFVLDRFRVVRYHGRIDDQYGVGYSRANVTRQDVAVAIDELLAGQSVSTPQTEVVGCFIGKVRRHKPQGDVTYSNQIARMMQTHCERCHRPGEIAPFALQSYDDVSAWAETILEVMEDGRMPPWHANPKHGHFENDARMTDEERALFARWVENGLPAGDPADLPEPVEYSEDWLIGTPDVIYKMPKAFTVPAKGVVPYKYFVFDPGFEKDVWVKASEIRPGNREVVHHAFLFYIPPGQERHHGEDALFNSVAGYAPGVPQGVMKEGYCWRIPAGSKLAFQMHYTPNGSEQTDRTEVGLLLAEPDQVDRVIRTQAALNLDFKIPPHAPRHRVVAGHRFTQDMLVHTLNPHMHYRGRSFRFTAKYPDGSEEVLLDVPRYDFNWQNTYILAEPKRMPAGTVMLCEGIFDNSEDNLVNPDPTKEVKWGDQTWDEMMLGSFLVSLPDDVERGEFPKVVDRDDGRFEVTFRFEATGRFAGAEQVSIAGSFNQWNKEATLMDGPDEDGVFTTTLTLPAGYLQYKFVINGEHWISDPGNPDRTGPFDNCVVQALPLARGEETDMAASPQSTALRRAAAAGDLGDVQRLVDAGADVNACDEHGAGTLLTVHPDVVQYLLTRGADPNVQKNESGASVLAGLAYLKARDCVRMLLEAGADPNRGRDASLESPLHHALAGTGTKHEVDVIRLLLDAG
ncbi:Ankyrin repeat and KH domain-containing protein 1 (HIV-1 Vpr-binding ankyrin repeat protein) (Multiple ankyrin repeats single KH domain) (hMASK), partial [Durusdinium trenchii]